MAVIKIVPMPGAVGDKGDEGAPGPQGQQGPAGQNGLPGTPALWSYQGAWQSNAAYATGDIVTYQGQLYYTKSVTTAGTLPTVTAKFDLIASKGADGTNGTNGTNGADGSPGLVYLGDYVSGNGYIANIAVVKGADENLYIAKASGGLLSPVANPGQWDLFLPKGANGADGATPFTLIGAYDNGAAYNLGIAVYYNGGTYVRTGNPLNPGYPPEVGAINASWTPIAEKGSDFNSTNGLVVTGLIDDPAVNPNGGMALSVQGGGYTALMDLVAQSGTFNGSLYVSAFLPNTTTIIETPTTINNDLTVTGNVSMPSLITSGTWDTNIKGQSQISGGLSLGLNNPGFGSYYCIGDLVTFEFRYNLSDSPIGGGSYSPITFNSSVDSGFSFKLPFPIREPYQGGVASNGYHYAANEYIFNGNFFGRVDSNPLPGINMPDEEGWVNVNAIGFTDERDQNNRQSFVILDIPADAESINTNVKTNRRMTHQWPFDFSGTPEPYHHYFDIRVTGTYIKA
jgi:hypothetical protein